MGVKTTSTTDSNEIRNRWLVIIAVAVVCLAIILGIRHNLGKPIDDYRFHTPPPGPNARPDPPNPDKVKHLPGALKIK